MTTYRQINELTLSSILVKCLGAVLVELHGAVALAHTVGKKGDAAAVFVGVGDVIQNFLLHDFVVTTADHAATWTAL